MKIAVQFGAGNIGRGFIAALLSRAGYKLVFADVNKELVSAINKAGSYTVRVMDEQSCEMQVSNVAAVDSNSDEVVELIAQAQIVTTAVGVRVLPFIAPAIAKGIARRMENGVEEPLNVIACENAILGTTQLQNEVYTHLTEEQKEWCSAHVGFPNCSVDRIVPPVRSENPVDVAVESYYEWNVDSKAFVGGESDIEGMNMVENLQAYVERKLLTLNTGHAITAYLGRMQACTTIAQSIALPKIYDIVRAAMRESGEVLVQKYGFDKETHFAYIDRIIKRFSNPYLQDDVERVGRDPIRKLSENDRLLKPLLAAKTCGLAYDNLLLGVAAALHFDCKEDPKAVELAEMIASEGLGKTIEKVCGVSESDPLSSQIKEAYEAIEKI